MSDDEELLRLDGLEVHFPIRGGFLDTILRRTSGVVRAVDGIDPTPRRGEGLGLVGESGSGKNTTRRGIVKLTPPTARPGALDGPGRPAPGGTRPLRDYPPPG